MDLDSSKSASKCAKTHVRAFEISKIFPGLYPRTPVLGGRGPPGRGGREGWEERGWEGDEGDGNGSLQEGRRAGGGKGRRGRGRERNS
jgi:hypothetical protein